MNYFPLTKDQQEWKDRAVGIAERDIEPRAAHYDRGAAFPQESLNALRDAVDTIDGAIQAWQGARIPHVSGVRTRIPLQW